MAAALERFYKGDDAKQNRELKIFRSCNNKISKILRWTHENDDSIDELRELALSQGGLYNASMRQKAWPAVLGTRTNIAAFLHEEIAENADMDIIRKDVQRSALFRSQAVAGSIVKGEQQSENLQNKLISVLNASLSTADTTKEKPCYYQGLHDVAFVLLFNLDYDEAATTAVLQKLMQSHLKDAARKDFSNVTFLLDSFLLPLIYSLDVEVYQALVESEVPLTNAILPWLITLFTHSVQDGPVASRLMDAFIGNSNPMLPFYMAVALLLDPVLRQQVLASAYDPVTMHFAIHSLPGQMKNDFAEGEDSEEIVRAQDVIESAMKIMQQNPPESLLRFLGGGLKKRARRRLRNKARRISMMQIPVPQSQSLLKASTDKLRRVVPKAKEMVTNMACMAAALAVQVSQQGLRGLQSLLLFLLVPNQYVKQFFVLLQGFTECLVSPDWSLLESYQNKKKEKNFLRNYYDCDYDDAELPGMVNMSVNMSIYEMDQSDHDVSMDVV